jgi:hypothetical protein
MIGEAGEPRPKRLDAQMGAANNESGCYFYCTMVAPGINGSPPCWLGQREESVDVVDGGYGVYVYIWMAWTASRSPGIPFHCQTPSTPSCEKECAVSLLFP